MIWIYRTLGGTSISSVIIKQFCNWYKRNEFLLWYYFQLLVISFSSLCNFDNLWKKGLEDKRLWFSWSALANYHHERSVIAFDSIDFCLIILVLHKFLIVLYIKEASDHLHDFTLFIIILKINFKQSQNMLRVGYSQWWLWLYLKHCPWWESWDQMLFEWWLIRI